MESLWLLISLEVIDFTLQREWWNFTLKCGLIFSFYFKCTPAVTKWIIAIIYKLESSLVISRSVHTGPSIQPYNWCIMLNQWVLLKSESGPRA